MTAEIINILSQFGQSTVAQIQANTKKVTGKTAASVRFEVTDQGSKAIFKILATKYFMAQETGIKPYPQYTKASKGFVDAIRAWASNVGVDPSLAYAIALSIHQKGTKLWQQGGRKDVVSNVINETLVDQIAAATLKDFAREYLASAVKTFYGNSN